MVVEPAGTGSAFVIEPWAGVDALPSVLRYGPRGHSPLIHVVPGSKAVERDRSHDAGVRRVLNGGQACKTNPARLEALRFLSAAARFMIEEGDSRALLLRLSDGF